MVATDTSPSGRRPKARVIELAAACAGEAGRAFD